MKPLKTAPTRWKIGETMCLAAHHFEKMLAERRDDPSPYMEHFINELRLLGRAVERLGVAPRGPKRKTK